MRAVRLKQPAKADRKRIIVFGWFEGSHYWPPEIRIKEARSGTVNRYKLAAGVELPKAGCFDKGHNVVIDTATNEAVNIVCKHKVKEDKDKTPQELKAEQIYEDLKNKQEKEVREDRA